jgi:hypothetical protein
VIEKWPVCKRHTASTIIPSHISLHRRRDDLLLGRRLVGESDALLDVAL